MSHPHPPSGLHHLPGPHHPPGPHHRPGRGRIVGHYAPETTRQEFASALVELGERLMKSPKVNINGTPVAVADGLEFELAIERTHHGTEELKIWAAWPEADDEVISSTSALVFGPLDESAR
jgi:hypothetical protein